MEVTKFVNRQCIAFGFCINWNWKLGVEIQFLFWNIYFEFGKEKRKNEKNIQR